MDDRKLGLWVADQAIKAGVHIHQHCPVSQITATGGVFAGNSPEWQVFDYIVNVAGPWSNQLLEQSELLLQQALDLVRGSHLLLPAVSRYGHMLEVPGERRIVFVLPYQGKTLLGTTEVRQSLAEPIECSDAEQIYLLKLYNHYFSTQLCAADVQATFAGVRPLLGGSDSASTASREYALNWQQQVLTVSGGKWTTARALARTVVQHIQQRQ
jgi:glycerol-3-phosphate dehydrogenase